MSKRTVCTFCVLAFLWPLAMQSGSFGQATAGQWRSLVQMPVEVGRAIEAGASAQELGRLVEVLNRGRLPAPHFSSTSQLGGELREKEAVFALSGEWRGTRHSDAGREQI